MLGIDTYTLRAEHLPTSGPVLLAATHVSYPDFLFLEKAAIERGRYVRFMCRHDVWDVPGRAGPHGPDEARPVDREAPAAAYLRAGGCSREGEAVCAFPEAGISYSYTVRSLMRGVASLARETGAPVVPVALWGSQRICSVGCPTSSGSAPRPSLTRGRRVDLALRGADARSRPGDDLTEWTRDLGRSPDGAARGAPGAARTTGQRPGEWATWYPAHLGGAAPTRREAAELDSVPRSSVPPTWGPLRSRCRARSGLGGRSGRGGRAADPCVRWRRASSQPSGLVNGSSTRRTGGLASTKVSAMAPRIVSTRPSQG